MSLFSLIITLTYQYGRTQLINNLKRDIVNIGKDITFAKDLELYINHPNYVTNIIVILIPITTFLINYLPKLITI